MNCYWCHSTVLFNVSPDHPKRATEDHIRSKPECVSKNEYNGVRNRVTACYTCNQRRGREWCKRELDGLVHRTEWSIKQAEKNRLRVIRRKAMLERAEQMRIAMRPALVIRVADELNNAWPI